MSPFAGVELSAAALLVLAGLAKLARPDATRRAIRSVGWSVPATVVRIGGGAEAALGGIAIGYGGRLPAALVAASYLGFCGFVGVALRRGGSLASCGCLGKPDTPPTKAHILVTALLAAGSAGAVVRPLHGVSRLGQSGAGEVVALGIGVAALTWLVWLALAELPRLTRVSSP